MMASYRIKDKRELLAIERAWIGDNHRVTMPTRMLETEHMFVVIDDPDVAGDVVSLFLNAMFAWKKDEPLRVRIYELNVDTGTLTSDTLEISERCGSQPTLNGAAKLTVVWSLKWNKDNDELILTYKAEEANQFWVVRVNVRFLNDHNNENGEKLPEERRRS
eukprot:TRINITY_DN13382_c0_g1_i2.p2 TRINITY_DN13382_c0_g1~~TRINITY_DN13382_c0_g1_i2.p2  ORF type:complete len:162 (+),score=20.78 TRINITY_DN13382_c0_g1_i2:602-1087(+)